MKLIEKEELAKLLRDHYYLMALKEIGVESWKPDSKVADSRWYRETIKSDDELTNDYKNVIIETDK